jgi:hypothetical protein
LGNADIFSGMAWDLNVANRRATPRSSWGAVYRGGHARSSITPGYFAGFGHWTLRLPADQMTELEIVKSMGPETVRQIVCREAAPTFRVASSLCRSC